MQQGVAPHVPTISASFRRQSELFEAGEQKGVVSFSPRARDASESWAGLSLSFGHSVPLRMFCFYPEIKVFPFQYILPLHVPLSGFSVASSGLTLHQLPFQTSACSPKFVKQGPSSWHNNGKQSKVELYLKVVCLRKVLFLNKYTSHCSHIYRMYGRFLSKGFLFYPIIKHQFKNV